MTKCCATDCENEGIHKFPKLQTQRELWEKALRIPDFEAQKLSSLCSKHFSAEDYYFGGKSSYDYYAPITKTLKRTAVPTLFHYNHYKMKHDQHAVNYKIKQLLSHPQIVAVSENTSNLTGEMPFLRIINVTSLKNMLPDEGCDVDIKSEINDAIQDNENTNEVKIDTMICRTCLTENATIPLTESCDDGCTLGAMLKKIADVSIEEGISNVICSTCMEDLRFAIAFRRRARFADKTLRHRNLNTSVVDDDDAAATDMLSSFDVKHEPPPCELFETNFHDNTSNFESEKTVNVLKKESEHVALTDNSVYKRDHQYETDDTKQHPAKRPCETYDDIFNRYIVGLEEQEKKQELKPTLLSTINNKVINLKTIDQMQFNKNSNVSEESNLLESKPTKVTNFRQKEKKNMNCEVCGFLVFSNCHLYRHTKQVHPGVKPFKCTNCDKRFISTNAIKYHRSFACHARLCAESVDRICDAQLSRP